MLALFLLYMSEVVSQEAPTPATLLGPQHFNYHAYQVRTNDVSPTKKGPVLFPNDSPPPPRPPLVVTSRPILESIARSDLNPLPQNNSIPNNQHPQTPGNHPFGNSAFDPNISSNPYQNFVDVDLIGLNPETQASSYNVVPYADLLRGQLYNYRQDNGYDFEQRPTLPPIYKAISDHAERNLVQRKKKPRPYNVQEKDYDLYDEKQTDENNHYAFSYRVNDHETGDDFSHSQQSSGSATNGEYRVRLPDGRTQIVSYTADENGYNANVRYEEAKERNSMKQNEKESNYATNHYYNQNENRNYNYFNYEPNINRNSNNYNDYDYSSEYSNYEPNPYQSKFSIYNPTVTPGTENERDSVKFESSTKAVIVDKIFTTLKPQLPSLVSPSLSPTSLSPSSYLASTIASLKDRITAKPVLSKSFIDRINKYIKFK